METLGDLIIALVNQFYSEYPDKNSQYLINWLDTLNAISIR